MYDEEISSIWERMKTEIPSSPVMEEIIPRKTKAPIREAAIKRKAVRTGGTRTLLSTGTPRSRGGDGLPAIIQVKLRISAEKNSVSIPTLAGPIP
jgi:hypothetical protein